MRASVVPALDLLAALVLLVTAAADATAQCEGARLQAANGAVSEQLGRSVAAAGTIAAAGSPADNNGDAGAPGAGSVTVYERTQTGWTQTAELLASDAEALDAFGLGLAVDLRRVVVGAPFEDRAGTDAGSVYVFDRRARGFVETARLVAPDAVAGDGFGTALALAGDTLLVAAPGADDLAADAGSVSVLRRTSTGWSREAELLPAAGAAGDGFGRSVGLARSGAYAAAWVGAPGASASAGSAHVFERSGSTWSAATRFAPTGLGADDGFGAALATDGATALVGAPGHDGAGTDAGAVWVFERGANGWRAAGTLVAPSLAGGDRFGSAVALTTLEDGSRVAVVGAPGAALLGAGTGAVHVFRHDGAGWSWIAAHTSLQAAGGEELGHAVAVTPDGALAGAPYGPAAQATGSVATFWFAGTDCNANGRFDGCDLADGTSVDHDGNGLPDACEPNVGTVFCRGDGSATACPCANQSPVGHDEGCLNSVGVGAQLVATGSPSLGADTVVFSGVGFGGTTATFFQGTARVAGGDGTPFGDGLLCAGGSVTRLGTSAVVGFTSSWPPPPPPTSVSVRGRVTAPGSRTYQALYRDGAGVCSASGTNLSGGVELYWGP